MLSLIIPLYRSEPNLPDLLKAIANLADQTPLEAVFVVDGSPDRCAFILERELPNQSFDSQLVQLSRNFGAFSAITAGLECGRGDCFAMLAADLQEPPELILEFVNRLTTGDVDVVVGERISREDPWLSRTFSSLFWRMFRRFAVGEVPPGGVDTFGCTKHVRDALLRLREVDSSLISLLFWLGFRRASIPFRRRQRTAGKSSWTLRKKIDYALYSFFSFTDLPVRILLVSGSLAAVLALLVGTIIFTARVLGLIHVPGYTVLALLIVFYGGITTFGLGIIGQYVWLALQNARQRPRYIIRSTNFFSPASSSALPPPIHP